MNDLKFTTAGDYMKTNEQITQLMSNPMVPVVDGRVSTFPYVRDIILPTGEFCCVDINRHAVPVTRDITVPETSSSTVVSLTRPDSSQPPSTLYTRKGILHE